MAIDFTFEECKVAGDGRGSVHIRATGSEDVQELCDHFRLADKQGVASVARLVLSEDHTLTLSPKPMEAKRPWFLVESALDLEFTTVYENLLVKLTGYDQGFPLPEMDLTDNHPRRLCHTHLTAKCGLEHGHYTFAVLVQSQDWNGKEAWERADGMAVEYAAGDIGESARSEERIDEVSDGRGGTRRIKTGRYIRIPAKPKLEADWLWQRYFGYWLDNYATEGQRAVVAECRDLCKKNRSGDPFEIKYNRVPLGPFHVDNWKRSISVDEFQTL